MKKILKIAIMIVVCLGIIGLTGCNKYEKNDKLTIISTSFPGYDLARAITKGSPDIDVKMLLKPGSETHNFEPTPKNIKDIENCSIFIYVGGESDEWINDVLSAIDTSNLIIVKLMDLVDLKEEDIIEGMESDEEEEEIEYDEHVWTNPLNDIKIIEKLKEEIIKIDLNNKDLYQKNANNYINELKSIDLEIREIVKNSRRREIIFGDRFPFRYFVDEYSLSYYAAFPGCSEQTEASSKTIAFLIDKVKSDNIPVVLHLELSNSKIANQIAKETNAKVLEFHSAHNISANDFESGITMVDIMKNNLEVLKEALNS